MSAFVDATALQSPDDFVWQLSLWPPDRAIAMPLVRRARRQLTVIVHEPIVVANAQPVIVEAAPGTFPCTWPKCDRGASNPFPSSAQLANHRFAAHGVRSSNEQSIARQQRRDRKRAAARGTPPPEYIDVDLIRTAIQQFLPLNLPPEIRTGPLDPGEREQLRRRITHFITRDWMREFRRSPAELAVAITQLGAAGFVPPRLFDDSHKAERMVDGLAALFNDRSAAGDRSAARGAQ